MDQLSFGELGLSTKISSAIDEMGFVNTTEIQAKSIPVILSNRDMIGKSQTGTGKTIAFGIPAVELILRNKQQGVQVLILCPTRELACQASDVIRSLTKFVHGVKVADVYGGAPMASQISKLKTANIVVGTPGRIMDHMRRRTLKLDGVRLVVLDEADEMLSMGFRDDIEEILTKTPQDRQTVMFSATMSREIFALTQKYQKDPLMIEIDKKKVTVDNIEQKYYDVPMGRKTDALNLILKMHAPNRAIVFCNTKKVVDDITDYLNKCSFNIEGIHGDMKQSQRTKVMNNFKMGRTNVLVATDVAARGIDVNDIDLVINYDIPQNTEYYIHRIGRTGRAGKSGVAVTICSGRRQAEILKRIGRLVKVSIKYVEIPKISDIRKVKDEANCTKVEEFIQNTSELKYTPMVSQLIQKGYDPEILAAAAFQMCFAQDDVGYEIEDIENVKRFAGGKSSNVGPRSNYKKIVINVGRIHRVAPNHIVGAITESTKLHGRDIGKIEIYDDKTIVAVPGVSVRDTVNEMRNCKICGRTTYTKVYKIH